MRLFNRGAFYIPKIRKEGDRMPQQQSENRKRAREVYEKHEGNISNREIARILDISEKTIGGWKSKDNWTGKIRSTPKENKRSTPKKKGGQPGNKNATGPPGNRHAEKHGFFTKWLPKETMDIMDEIKNDDPLDLLWDNIQLQYVAIVRAQQLMHVKDQGDKTIEKIGESFGKVESQTWEVQQAWDKQANFMGAQARAMKTLESMIKTYEELLSKQSGTASEEQRARIDQLKAQTKKLDKDNNNEDAAESVVIHDDIPK